MKNDKLNQVTNLFLEFYPLYQQKITSLFPKSTSDPYKCNLNQIRTIMIIGRNKSIIPTTLGESLGLQKGSLTTLLDSLEKMELVERRPHPDDRRKLILSLTSKGIEYRDLKINQFGIEISNLFDEIPEDKLDDFIACFGNVLDTIKKL